MDSWESLSNDEIDKSDDKMYSSLDIINAVRWLFFHQSTGSDVSGMTEHFLLSTEVHLILIIDEIRQS